MSIKESALTAIQTIADTDFFRAVTSVGASRKVLASDVGKYVLEDYESELAGSEQSVTDAIDAMNDDLNEKNADALDRIKKSLIVDSASGSIASFNDGNDVFPFISCVADITPRQDLHGYSSPWVGGAGKNKLQNTATTKTENGITFTVNFDGTVTVNGTATATTYLQFTFTLSAGSYVYTSGVTEWRDHTFDTFIQNGTTTIARGNNSDSPGNSFTLSADATLKYNIRIANGYTIPTGTIFKPMIRQIGRAHV